jgi:hypothetical protein
MKITSDWHIHSANSCDEAALSVRDLLSEAPAKGIRDDIAMPIAGGLLGPRWAPTCPAGKAARGPHHPPEADLRQGGQAAAAQRPPQDDICRGVRCEKARPVHSR